MEQRGSSEVNMFALYVVGISSIPVTAYGSLSTALENRLVWPSPLLFPPRQKKARKIFLNYVLSGKEWERK